jgi:hypothetical protein
MADAINRIVHSSVAVERGGWKEKEGQKQKGRDGNARAQSPEKADADSIGAVGAAPDEGLGDKGKHLDISALIDD